VSAGKDTPSGHWELAGLAVPWDWTFFPDTAPAFPADLTRAAAEAAATDGILGNCHASGTEIINRLGSEHIRSGWPICYTSADSVFQIAAHEEHFGLKRLLRMCEALAPRLHRMRVGRVIARPFVGEVGAFARTANRRDFAVSPPRPVLTDWVQEAGGRVHAIGKIGDIFAMQGIDTTAKGSDVDLMRALHRAVREQPDGSLTFANFVEFDSVFGHRRDPSGYARQLEWFDQEIAAVLNDLKAGDLMILTADHGNDPTCPVPTTRVNGCRSWGPVQVRKQWDCGLSWMSPQVLPTTLACSSGDRGGRFSDLFQFALQTGYAGPNRGNS
jgi:phosphopentomutase